MPSEKFGAKRSAIVVAKDSTSYESIQMSSRSLAASAALCYTTDDVGVDTRLKHKGK